MASLHITRWSKAERALLTSFFFSLLFEQFSFFFFLLLLLPLMDCMEFVEIENHLLFLVLPFPTSASASTSTSTSSTGSSGWFAYCTVLVSGGGCLRLQ